MQSSATISALDYGADPTGDVDSTTAITNALAACSALGGGYVTLPYGTFKISELTIPADVTLRGETNGYSYTTSKTNSILNCVSGVYAVMLEGRAGLQDIGINSNASTSGPPYSSDGVEYGVVIYFGATTMRNVSVYGFQYGVTIANGGNSNIFEDCAFNFNSKAGFVVTKGSQACFDVYHPNLPYPQYNGSNYFEVTTVFTLRNCNISRNLFGIILRDGGGTFDRVLTESNYYAGLMYYIGDLDNSASGTWFGYYCEGNWASYVRPGPNYPISSITVLYTSTGTPLVLTDSNNPAVDENGFQIYFLSSKTTNVITNVEMHRTSVVNTPNVKQMYLQSAYKPVFNFMGSSGGDQTNAIRFNGGSGQLCTAAQFIEYQGTIDVTQGNRCVAYNYETGYSGGGMTATSGFYRGLAGNVVYPATPLPVTVTGTGYDAAAYPEQSSFIVNSSGTFTITFRPANENTYSGGGGRWLYIKTIAANAVNSASSNIVPINSATPGTAILPATAGAWALLQSDGTNWVIMAKG